MPLFEQASTPRLASRYRRPESPPNEPRIASVENRCLGSTQREARVQPRGAMTRRYEGALCLTLRVLPTLSFFPFSLLLGS